MLKLTNSQRNWLVLAIVAWLVIMAGLIFIPKTRPASSAQEPVIAPTNSIATTLHSITPAGGAVAAQLIDPSKVYDTNTYGGYMTLCPNEEPEFLNAKLTAFGLDQAEMDLNGEYGYMVLLPPTDDQEVGLDQVALSDVDICTFPQTEPYPLDASIPFFKQGGQWVLGIRG